MWANESERFLNSILPNFIFLCFLTFALKLSHFETRENSSTIIIRPNLSSKNENNVHFTNKKVLVGLRLQVNRTIFCRNKIPDLLEYWMKMVLTKNVLSFILVRSLKVRYWKTVNQDFFSIYIFLQKKQKRKCWNSFLSIPLGLLQKIILLKIFFSFYLLAWRSNSTFFLLLGNSLL